MAHSYDVARLCQLEPVSRRLGRVGPPIDDAPEPTGYIVCRICAVVVVRLHGTRPSSNVVGDPVAVVVVQHASIHGVVAIGRGDDVARVESAEPAPRTGHVGVRRVVGGLRGIYRGIDGPDVVLYVLS